MNKNEENKFFPKTTINWYPGHMAKTKRLIKEQINLIDVVYEVIDARMPVSSKIIDIDELIFGIPRILIFNKNDLCDIKETKKWMDYYESKGYNIISYNLEGNPDMKKLTDLTMKVVKETLEKRNQKGLKNRKVRALVMGIPNVGKSTLINRLASKKVVGIGNKPGVTKSLSWIRVNDDIELLDSPGILWPKLDEKNAFNLAAFTAIKEEVLPLYDVVYYILETLNKYYPEKLKERYGLDFLDEDMIANLEFIGKKRGCLIKGGEIDYDKVIDIVINDIKNGYIKGITFDRYENVEYE